MKTSSDNHPTAGRNHPTRRGDSVTAGKKLIEVALPLDAINKACAREKSIGSETRVLLSRGNREELWQTEMRDGY